MASIVQAPQGASGWLVACLCAEWCGTCRDYRAAFDGVAGGHPEVAFVWVDVEDDARWMGDIDVENFPTLLIASDAEVRFFGTMLPHPEQLTRLIASVRVHHGVVAGDDDLPALLGHLRDALERH